MGSFRVGNGRCAPLGGLGMLVLEQRRRQDNQRQSFQVLKHTDREVCLARSPRAVRSFATVALPAEGRAVGSKTSVSGAWGWVDGFEPPSRKRARLLLDRIKRDKGVWWMPWQQEAMKDVALCDKPGGGESTL